MMKSLVPFAMRAALVALTVFSSQLSLSHASKAAVSETLKKNPSASVRTIATPESQACRLCSELMSIVEETRKESKRPKFDIDSLQLRASSVIQKMPDANGSLTTLQIRAIVAAFAASVPHDPAAAILENNLELIKTNRAGFTAEITKLPQASASELTEAIAIAVNVDAEGTDPSH